MYGSLSGVAIKDFIVLLLFIFFVLAVILIIGILRHRSILFAMTGAHEVERKDEPKIYNIVENLCISRGLSVPRIGIIESNNLNAFATGWKKDDASIVFTRWLLQKLNKEEIRAVAGHELTHILNGDVKNMVIINLFIGAISNISFVMMRARWRWRNPLPILWVFLYFVSITLLPFISLAVSKNKEYLADAWSVELTKNSQAMISALEKISKESYVVTADGKGRNIASMFIVHPWPKQYFLLKVREFFSTHPSIESRIEELKKF